MVFKKLVRKDPGIIAYGERQENLYLPLRIMELKERVLRLRAKKASSSFTEKYIQDTIKGGKDESKNGIKGNS